METPRSINHWKQSGIGLLEVLIAVLVLSVGLLGLAGLQMHGMRQTQASGSLSIAAPLAEEMAERMRSNLAGVVASRYGNVSVRGRSCDGTCPTADSLPECYGVQCNERKIAEADIAAWRYKICTLMPCGTTAGVTCVDADNDDASCAETARYDIRIHWTDVAAKVVSGVLETQAETRRHVLVIQPLKPVQ